MSETTNKRSFINITRIVRKEIPKPYEDGYLDLTPGESRFPQVFLSHGYSGINGGEGWIRCNRFAEEVVELIKITPDHKLLHARLDLELSEGYLHVVSIHLVDREEDLHKLTSLRHFGRY